MKCEHCPFKFNEESWETPVYQCNFFYDETPEPFYEEDGCNLKYQEAKKLDELQCRWQSLSYGSDWTYRQMCEPDYKPTPEELKEEEERRKESKKAYNDYLEILKERRKIKNHKKYHKQDIDF